MVSQRDLRNVQEQLKQVTRVSSVNRAVSPSQNGVSSSVGPPPTTETSAPERVLSRDELRGIGKSILFAEKQVYLVQKDISEIRDRQRSDVRRAKERGRDVTALNAKYDARVAAKQEALVQRQERLSDLQSQLRQEGVNINQARAAAPKHRFSSRALDSSLPPLNPVAPIGSGPTGVRVSQDVVQTRDGSYAVTSRFSGGVYSPTQGPLRGQQVIVTPRGVGGYGTAGQLVNELQGKPFTPGRLNNPPQLRNQIVGVRQGNTVNLGPDSITVETGDTRTVLKNIPLSSIRGQNGTNRVNNLSDIRAVGPGDSILSVQIPSDTPEARATRNLEAVERRIQQVQDREAAFFSKDSVVSYLGTAEKIGSVLTGGARITAPDGFTIKKSLLSQLSIQPTPLEERGLITGAAQNIVQGTVSLPVYLPASLFFASQKVNAAGDVLISSVAPEGININKPLLPQLKQDFFSNKIAGGIAQGGPRNIFDEAKLFSVDVADDFTINKPILRQVTVRPAGAGVPLEAGPFSFAPGGTPINQEGLATIGSAVLFGSIGAYANTPPGGFTGKPQGTISVRGIGRQEFTGRGQQVNPIIEPSPITITTFQEGLTGPRGLFQKGTTKIVEFDGSRFVNRQFGGTLQQPFYRELSIIRRGPGGYKTTPEGIILEQVQVFKKGKLMETFEQPAESFGRIVTSKDLNVLKGTIETKNTLVQETIKPVSDQLITNYRTATNPEYNLYKTKVSYKMPKPADLIRFLREKDSIVNPEVLRQITTSENIGRTVQENILVQGAGRENVLRFNEPVGKKQVLTGSLNVATEARAISMTDRAFFGVRGTPIKRVFTEIGDSFTKKVTVGKSRRVIEGTTNIRLEAAEIPKNEFTQSFNKITTQRNAAITEGKNVYIEEFNTASGVIRKPLIETAGKKTISISGEFQLQPASINRVPLQRAINTGIGRLNNFFEPFVRNPQEIILTPFRKGAQQVKQLPQIFKEVLPETPASKLFKRMTDQQVQDSFARAARRAAEKNILPDTPASKALREITDKRVRQIFRQEAERAKKPEVLPDTQASNALKQLLNPKAAKPKPTATLTETAQVGLIQASNQPFTFNIPTGTKTVRQSQRVIPFVSAENFEGELLEPIPEPIIEQEQRPRMRTVNPGVTINRGRVTNPGKLTNIGKETTITSTNQISSPTQITNPDQITSPTTITSPTQVTEPTQVTSPTQVTTPSQVNVVRQNLLRLQRNNLLITGTARTTPPPPPRSSNPSRPLGSSVRRKLQQAFLLEVRRAGKFVKEGDLLTRDEALQLGIRKTKESLASTFRIKESNQLIEPRNGKSASIDMGRYRDYQIVKGKRVPLRNTYIERRGRRLDTGAERTALIKAKKQAGFFRKGRKMRRGAGLI